MAIQIQVKRGVVANRPTLQDGEFYFATDTGQLYVGFGGAILQVGSPVMASVSLSDTTGKAQAMKAGQLTTTAVTVNQVVLTYTVTALKTLFLQYFSFAARLTAASATGSVLGTISIRIGGTVVYNAEFVNPTTSSSERESVTLSEPIPIAAGTVVDIVVTPAVATSIKWTGNFGGYEK